MGNYVISLNQLADFSKATVNRKKRIITQQLNPNKFLVPWYQLAKARMRKSLIEKGNLDPIYDAIKILTNRKPKNQRQINDKAVSIEALKRFIKLKLPVIFKKNQYSLVRPKIKNTKISDVEIIVAPEVIVRFEIDGQKILGAVKIHISKGKPFDYKQSIIVSTIIHKYLLEIKKNDEIVDPNLCFSLDVFGNRITSAPINIDEALIEIQKNCDEVKAIWNVA